MFPKCSSETFQSRGCEDKEEQLTALPHTHALARSLLEAGAGRSRFCWDEERRSRAGTAMAPLETTGAPRSDPAPRRRLALTGKTDPSFIQNSRKWICAARLCWAASPGSPVGRGDWDGVIAQGELGGDRSNGSRGQGD